jgi:hypothetical protein
MVKCNASLMYSRNPSLLGTATTATFSTTSASTPATAERARLGCNYSRPFHAISKGCSVQTLFRDLSLAEAAAACVEV